MITRTLHAAVAALVLALTAAPAGAALNSTESAEPAKGPTVNAAQATPPARPARAAGRGTGTLRCWNYGRLVYEGSARGQVTPTQSAVFNVPSDDRNVQIIDLKSGFCVLD